MTILLALSFSVAYGVNENVNATEPINCSGLRSCFDNCSTIQNCVEYMNCIENCTIIATTAFEAAKSARMTNVTTTMTNTTNMTLEKAIAAKNKDVARRASDWLNP